LDQEKSGNPGLQQETMTGQKKVNFVTGAAFQANFEIEILLENLGKHFK
jgi:hypothetical protein